MDSAMHIEYWTKKNNIILYKPYRSSNCLDFKTYPDQHARHMPVEYRIRSFVVKTNDYKIQRVADDDGVNNYVVRNGKPG